MDSRDLFKQIEKIKEKDKYKFLFLNLLENTPNKLKIYKAYLSNNKGFVKKYIVIKKSFIEMFNKEA